MQWAGSAVCCAAISSLQPVQLPCLARPQLSACESESGSLAAQIANRIKAKGLQKLRWYCQMCQKQCRDENGFKCHLTSEGHKRQMMVFGQSPTRGGLCIWAAM